MRNMKKYGTAIAAASMVMALVGASSASAATWPGTVMHGHGNLVLHSGSATVTCTVTLNVKATGDLAQTTNAAGTLAGPTFSACTNSLGVTPTAVTATASWTLTATSTTAVDATNVNYFINVGNGVCTTTADNVSVAGNTWSNASHTLTFNSTPTFPIAKTGLCLGFATTGFITGSIVVPAAIIT